MQAKRHFGYRRDTHDISLDAKTSALFGTSIVVPSAHTQAQWIDFPRDQDQTEECVAFGLARCIHMRSRATGVPIDWPSTTAIYTWARNMERLASDTPEVPLADEGSIPSYAVAGMTQFGVPSDATWPFGTGATVDDEPTQEDIKLASTYRVDGFNRISSTGAQRIAEVQQAIANDYPVLVCKQIDKAFMDAEAGTIVTASDPKEITGGHATVLYGYNATNKLLGINSWGTTWCDAGFYVCDDLFITDPLMSDIYVVVGAPIAV